MNIELAYQVVNLLYARGVREFCLCPGRRNAPFVSVLEQLASQHPSLQIHSFFDERAAGFFALGCMKRSARPVAVCTTSGTACAELLPAAVEAWYAGYPLILLTSDRPRRLRGSGAPQSIEQVGLYSSYVSACLDIATLSELPAQLPCANTPLHLNVCFDEPVLDGVIPAHALISAEPSPVQRNEASLPSQRSDARQALNDFLSGASFPLVVVGPLDHSVRPVIEQFLLRLGAPIYAEAASQLRGSAVLSDLLLHSGNSFVRSLLERGTVDAVLRIGGVPAPRIWRDLDEKLRAIPVCSLTERPFAGLGRGSLIHAPLAQVLDGVVPPRSYQDVAAREIVIATDRAERARIEALCERYPRSEVGLLRQLDAHIPHTARVYLGNSLPIREWDLASDEQGKMREFAVNRGANGIDGQLSTFFGWCAREPMRAAPERREAWGVFGDLTTMYDLSAPWALQFCGEEPLRIAVVNNRGGQIFSRMFSSPLFLNQHELTFAEWAAMWKMGYQRWTGAEALCALPTRAVLEICPDSSETLQFWQNFEVGTRI